MTDLSLSVLNMSLIAGYVILFIILIRLPLKKAPKVISYALWSVAAFRLLCPFSFESVFSLLPTNAAPIPQDIAYQQSPQIESGIHTVDTIVNAALPALVVEASVNPLQIYIQIGAYIWLLGIAVMLVYGIVSVLILKKRLKSAQNIEQNIYKADNLKTPFVLGILRPRVFIPAGLAAEEKSYIIRHEQTHIRRFDHIVKPFAFLVLSIHWFNPLVWIAFVLMGTDMELSCDERVIKEMGGEIKKAYSSSLLSLATGRHILNGSPLAFGEGNVKGRIKNILNYKKPAFWVIAVTLIAVITVGTGLLANPRQSVSLLDSSILPGEGEPQLERARANVVSVTLKVPQGDQTASATITTRDGNFGWGQLVVFLESVMVNEKAISQSLDEERDKTYQIIFNRQLNENVLPIKFNFSGDFREVWINNGVKPSYSHRVIDPSAVSDYLPVFFASLAAPTEQPLIFSSDETDLPKLGTIAFDTYMVLRMSEKTPVSERIASYKLNDISVLAGDINEFCVSLNYDFTTDNDSYVNPPRGAKGKGTWPDNYLELRVQHAYEDVYSIIGIGTGGGAQGLEPYAPEQTPLEPTAPEWSPEQSIDIVGIPELDYASDDIVIFHGYFGLFVYDLDSRQIIRSLDLEPLKCAAIQGGDYSEVTVSTDGNTVQLHRLSSENMYVYTVSDNTLWETTYERMNDRFGSNFVPIEDVVDSRNLGNYSYNAVRFDTGEYGYLHISDWTLGTLTYVRGDMVYALFDRIDHIQAGQQHTIPVLSGKTYVDLTKDGNLEVSAEELFNYQLYTNSEKITVSMQKGDHEGAFTLYDTENNTDIQQFNLNKNINSKSFANLTSSRNYYIVASGLGDLIITVSD